MRRDKTAARIILILSVVHVAVAAPAIVRQRSLDVDDDVTTASEKRGNPGDTPQDLYPVPQIDNELPTTSGTPHLQSDPPPTSGTPPVDYDRLATAYNVRFYRVWKWLQDVHPPAPIGGTLHSGPEPPPPKLEAPPPPPEANEVFSDAIKQKLKVLAGFGAVASVSAGLVYGVHKLIEDHSHETQSVTSSDVVGRGVSTLPRTSRLGKPVSRALANLNLRNEDLGLLSVLTRRLLERLD